MLISRRKFIEAGAGGLAFVLAGGPRACGALAVTPPAGARGTAKAVIQIWMWGGASHLDTFDPKPGAGRDFTGPFEKPLATNVDGIVINELLPLLARQADRYSIIRSMTHGINGHESASYIVQTGRPPGGPVAFPCVGAVVSVFKGYEAGYGGRVPPYIVLTQPQGRFSEAGFLGLKHRPFATGGDPAAERFAVEGVVLTGVSDERQLRRRELLAALNTFRQAAAREPELAAADRAREDAYEMILGDGGKVFDLAQEPEALRERYGKNTFGQSCLAARRLVEQGVPYVTINYQGWDTHKQHFQAMRRKLPEMDKGFSALLEDLSQRGLLDSTVVWWGGEFGRSPSVQWEPPWNGGRNHYGNVFCSVLAGGGFQGGRVVGASDPRGEEVLDRPVYPCDLIGSIYERLGIDPGGRLPNPEGLNVSVVPGADEGVKSGGRLKELV